MNKEVLRKFVLDPDWPIMQSFILEFFERSSSIEDIDTTLPPAVVHAEVIARKEMKSSIDKLIATMNSVQPEEATKKTSFR